MNKRIIQKAKNDALIFLGNEIIHRGESKFNANLGFIPTGWFTFTTPTFEKISDLFTEKGFTHYDLKWDIPLKTVKVTLYKGESLAACLNFHDQEDHIVPIIPEKERVK